MVEISLSLCLAQLYFFAVCWHGQPAFDCHGYRLLCCHRPSSALYTPNDSLQMWTAGGWVMGRGPLWLFDPKLDANLSFYNNLEIPHFLCDFKPLLRLSCSDAHLSEDLMMVLTGLLGIVPLLCIISSYAHIFLAVAQDPSAQGKQHRANSTWPHAAPTSPLSSSSTAQSLPPTWSPRQLLMPLGSWCCYHVCPGNPHSQSFHL